MYTPSLLGLHVVITRPTHQAQTLKEKINQYQGVSFEFPTLEIIPLSLNDFFQPLSSHYDIAIFTSQNAAKYAADCLPLPANVKTMAIGPSTARVLLVQNQKVDFMPSQFNSEHLLAMEICKNITDEKIVLFGGEGGRTLIENELSQKGAEVIKIPVYRRNCPLVSPQTMCNLTALNSRVITLTSGEAVQNLVQIFNQYPVYREWLFTSPILVVSQRVRQVALDLGFQEPLIFLSENAGDQAILESLIKWYSTKVGL